MIIPIAPPENRPASRFPCLPCAARVRVRGLGVLLAFFLIGQAGFAGSAAAGPDTQERAALRTHPYHGYNIIIMIDKALQGTALHAQRLRYFRYDPDSQRLSYVNRWPISTGMEIPKENLVGRITPRTTLPGYFAVDVLQEDAYSNSWDGPMAFSVFYDFPRYAIHATEWFNYFKLGRRASGGCTRLTMENALQLFDEVSRLGKGWTYKINRHSGRPVLSEAGTPIVQWGYRALVVIEEGSRLEPTHFGFKDRDLVYATSDSVSQFIDFPNAAKPSPSSSLPVQEVFSETSG